MLRVKPRRYTFGLESSSHSGARTNSLTISKYEAIMRNIEGLRCPRFRTDRPRRAYTVRRGPNLQDVQLWGFHDADIKGRLILCGGHTSPSTKKCASGNSSVAV